MTVKKILVAWNDQKQLLSFWT